MLLLVAIAGVGLFQIMDLIHHQTRDQIRADQCTGYQVLRLRAARLALDQSYFRLDQERAAALLACVSPPTCEIAEESYRALAHFEKAKQLLIKATWDADAIRWSIGGGHESCKLIHGFRSPYPPFRYPIVNPELSVFDLQASTFTQNKNESLRLSIYLTQERSSAEASKGVDHDWTVRWIE